MTMELQARDNGIAFVVHFGRQVSQWGEGIASFSLGLAFSLDQVPLRLDGNLKGAIWGRVMAVEFWSLVLHE
jgi:hypothetical protein